MDRHVRLFTVHRLPELPPPCGTRPRGVNVNVCMCEFQNNTTQYDGALCDFLHTHTSHPHCHSGLLNPRVATAHALLEMW